MIYENQQDYYNSLAIADAQNDSSEFIEFMLDIILSTVIAYKTSGNESKTTLEELPAELTSIEMQVFLLIKKYFADHETINTAIAVKLIGKSSPTVRKHLSRLVSLGLLEAHGSNKNRTYSLKK